MALTGQSSTFLERCIDGMISLPCDVQRMMGLIKDLDERVEDLRASCAQQCEALCQRPNAASRGVSAEHAQEIAAARANLEADQQSLMFLAAEKAEVRFRRQ